MKWFTRLLLNLFFGFALVVSFTLSAHAIVGGERVRDLTLYQSTVFVVTPWGFGTGAYLGENKVVTAAKNMWGQDANRVRIVLKDGFFSCTVRKQIFNRAFLEPTMYWEDIAILIIDCGNLDMSQNPVYKLPQSAAIPTENLAFVGYGFDSTEWDQDCDYCVGPNPTYPILNKISAGQVIDFESVFNDPAVSEADKRTFRRIQSEVMHGRMFCVSANVESTGYYGDYGAPVFSANSSGEAILTGLFSVALSKSRWARDIFANCGPTVARFSKWIADP